MDASRPDFVVASASGQSAAVLRYDPAEEAPRLLELETGEAAAGLLKRSTDLGIPVVERDACMERLLEGRPGAPVPEGSLDALTEIMSFLAQVQPELRKRWDV